MPDIIFPNLGITLETLNRVAFSIFGFEIYWYAIFVTTGIIAGVFFGAYFAPKRTGQNPELYTDFALWVIPACIVGARLWYVIFTWNENYTFADIFAVRGGGLAIHGVIAAAVITALIYTKAKKLNFLNFADTGIVGLIIGHVIGRFGNFINREAFGGYYTGLFAMEIRLDQVHNINTVTSEMLDNQIIREYAGTVVQYISVHPTFFYEAAANFALFIFLNLYRKHKKFNGELLAYYFLCYGITRFFIEGLRTDQLTFFGTGLPTAQIVSVLMASAGLAWLVYGFVKLRKTS